ncbi:MAG: phenylalanine--tRNA ligase subunit beta [Actinobacteria bacterium]|nr:phenylalanine--tRNA ligase subunit beta [Actinomycetota bacterium]
MKVPISWLEDFVDLPADIDALALNLTALGIKVDSIRRGGQGLEKVVVGEVLGIEEHSRSDRGLVVVRVTDGDRELQIVCGARNFSVGDRVPVALSGAVLPGLPGAVIGRKPVAGIDSEGMICDAMELGLAEARDGGIHLLPSGSPVGADIREVLGLDEVIFELDITPNRPDAMSFIGVAREVSVLTGGEVRLPDTSLPASGASGSGSVAVTLEDPSGCPRYQARVISGVEIGPSPPEVQRRLSAAGVRPISNVVDATNFALLICGHPMHAFDLDEVGGGEIVVRRARVKETLVTLDEQERRLDPEDLLIADTSRALALAGVMGGLDSEVSQRTKRVVIEIAYFDPPTILRTAKRHGLRTEASARFERGVDPNGIDFAGDLAARFVLEWAGGEMDPGSVDVYPDPILPARIELRPERANLVLGTDLTKQQMTEALAKLDLGPTDDGSSIVVEAPTRRPDLEVEEDLIEEVARVWGYDRIERKLPSGTDRVGGLTREQKLIRNVRWILRGAGLTEAYTSSFISSSDLERMGYPDAHPSAAAIPLVNPITQDEALLRPSLIPRLMAAVAGNVARRRLTVRLFEVGHCFRRSGSILPEEPLRLGIVMHGPLPRTWHGETRELDFYDLKGVVELIVHSLGAGIPSFEMAEEAMLHPTRAAGVSANGRYLGWMGELSPDIADTFDLPDRPLAAEIDLDALFEVAHDTIEVNEPPKFPSVLLDLAVTVPEEMASEEVVRLARENGGELLRAAGIFDVYRGEQTGEGRKSIALGLEFRSKDRTLTDSEALEAREAIASAIRDRLGGEVRG